MEYSPLDTPDLRKAILPHSSDDFLTVWHAICAEPLKTREYVHFMPSWQENPMGDVPSDGFQIGFDSRLKSTFCGSQATSDAGLLAYREWVEALELTKMGEEGLTDSRLRAQATSLW
ncbi:MAG: hypothetical protein IT427_00060 [Pirellulales bacterium]|nr:hypothetical protein [Pirellulales bacterium]